MCYTDVNILKQMRMHMFAEMEQKLTENYVSSNAQIKKASGIKEMPVRANDGPMLSLESLKNN